jgi:hypothetical protein
VHDKKTEWICGAFDELEKAGLVTLADKGYWAPRMRKSLQGEEQAGIPEDS